MPNLYEVRDPELERKRAIAEALMARAINPQPVNPGAYTKGNMLADILGAGVGAFQSSRLDKQEGERRDAFNKTLSEALTGPQAPADGVGPVQDKNDFLIRTLAGNEQTAPLAMDFQMRRSLKQSDNEADLRQALAVAEAKKRMGLDAPDPYFSPVQTSGGLFKFNARTGGYEAMTGPDGKPLMPPAIDATAQGDVARARAGGKAAGEAEGDIQKRTIGSTEILGLVKRARELLPNATSSGVGAVADSVAGFFGKSPEGANEAAALRVLAGNLTLKQPRMEGPQSDADRKLYAQMAADVGNASLPASQRMAALDEIERLNQKYAAFNGMFDGGQAGAALPAGGGQDSDPLGMR